MMLFLLAQVPASSATQIGEWLIAAAAVAVIAAAIKNLLVRKPSIEAEFVTKNQHEKDMSDLQKDVESLRGKMDRDAEKILNKIDTQTADLMLDGRRRSQALYNHIKETTTEIFTRLNTNDKQIAHLEERTK